MCIRDRSTEAQWAQMTVTEYSLMNCVWAHFLTGPMLCLDSSIVSPLWLHWAKGARMYRCNLPPAFLVEWPGSFMCHCSNTGMERTPNKESAHKVDSGEENSPTASAGIWTHNLLITSLALQPTNYPGSSYVWALLPLLVSVTVCQCL